MFIGRPILILITDLTHHINEKNACDQQGCETKTKGKDGNKLFVCLEQTKAESDRTPHRSVSSYLNPMVHNNCKNGQVQYSAAYKLG